MPPSIGDQHEMIHLLEDIKKQLVKQNSALHVFGVGIIYGIGFFVGSAIIATIAFGILAPFFADIPWIRDAFLTGVSWLH